MIMVVVELECLLMMIKRQQMLTLLMCAGLKQDKISKEEWRGLIRRKESKRLPY